MVPPFKRPIHTMESIFGMFRQAVLFEFVTAVGLKSGTSLFPQQVHISLPSMHLATYWFGMSQLEMLTTHLKQIAAIRVYFVNGARKPH